MSKTLLLCAPAPVADAPLGYRLDIKFVEGMRAHAADWDGPVHCILWRDGGDIPFGRAYLPSELGFDLTVLDAGARVPESAFGGAAVALISADQPQLDDAAQAARKAGVPMVVGIEYTLETRLRIVWLDRSIGLLRKLRRTQWLWARERKIKAALGAAAGLQINGFPAFDAYSALNARPLMYLDNRMTADLMATPEEMQTRAERLRSGAPLRLIHSGRLEPMKGAQDLLPVMEALRGLGVTATLDVYGAGSMAEELKRGAAAFAGSVRIHDPVDFETELVPNSRRDADIFLSCHRQSDPSCTYLEAMGCGLVIAGFANRMWSRLSAEAQTGVRAPLGDIQALATRIAALDRDRETLIQQAETGLAYAKAHDFHTEFHKRMEHLRACAL